MTDKNSDDEEEEKVVSLLDFKSKLKKKAEAEDAEAFEKVPKFKTPEQKRSFAVDALSDILSYAVVELHRAASTSTDEATVQMLQTTISNIDTAVLSVLHILRVKSPDK